MFRHIRLRARPTTRRSAVPHRQFRTGPQHNFNYTPQPQPTYYRPQSWRSRLRDMAIGSGITIGAYLIYQSYRYRRFVKELKGTEEEIKAVLAKRLEFSNALAEALEAGDHERLREVVFEFHRAAFAPFAEIVEVGPLPGFPEGDELYGKETIPVEDTLMFVEHDPADKDRVAVVNVIINAGVDELERVPSGQVVLAGSKKGKLGELLSRMEIQAAEWRRAGSLHEGDDIYVVFTMRDSNVIFVYVNSYFQSINILSEQEALPGEPV
ncbi:hypothetical protein F5B20DRAFT_259646 [Whalleya microplaca]|nr:hypothetical protein F5B20DRAFT_259646 [Whalleya microplaca]